MKLALLLSAFLLLQGVLILRCLLSGGLRPARPGRVGTLLLIEGLVVVSLVAGAYGEARWQALTYVSGLRQERGAQPPGVPGVTPDPSLRALVETRHPQVRPAPVERPEDFLAWQADLRGWLRDEKFQIDDISTPGEVPYEILESTVLESGVTRVFLAFVAFDGARIPAFMFIPPDARDLPGILVVPGHVGETESGIAQTGGLEASYQHGAALHLAEQGFVTLTHELRGFGPLGAPFNTEHRLVAYNALQAGTFYKAVVVKDLKRAMDILQGRPEVDGARIGITGVSYGGEMAVAYAALDVRVKAVVFQGYSGRVGAGRAVTGDADDQPHYCHIIPGGNRVLSGEDIFLLLAPRPTLGVLGDSDDEHDPEFREAMQVAWGALGQQGAVALQAQQGGHEFFLAPAVEFFQKYL